MIAHSPAVCAHQLTAPDSGRDSHAVVNRAHASVRLLVQTASKSFAMPRVSRGDQREKRMHMQLHGCLQRLHTSTGGGG